MKNIQYAMIIMATAGLFSCGGGATTETEVSDEPSEETGGTMVKGEDISYSADSITMNGYIAYDASSDEKRPGILVVHEWWGHNDYARNRADMLAEMGYTALAVDMYGDGKTAEHPSDAGAFAGQVMGNMEGAKARFMAALEILKNHPSVDPEQTAAIGYCFGGGVVLNMARMGMDLDGVVSFHGSLATGNPATAGSVKAKLLVCHGAADNFVPEEQLAAFKNEMESAGVDMEFISYEGAKHSFTNPEADAIDEKFQIGVAYNEAADKQSWEDMTSFFAELFK